MDDPWGSPWAASSDSLSRNELAPPPSPPKALLSPPPRALVGGFSASPAQSPWADDGGFGDWTGSDATHSKKSLADWGVWGDSTFQQPLPTPRHDGSGRASPLAWPSSAANSPGLKPLPRSRTSSIFRQPSPDPWSAEFSLKNRRDTFSSFSLSIHEEPSGPSKPESSSVVEVTQPSRLDTATGGDRLVKDGGLKSDEAGASIEKHEPSQPRAPPVITTSRNTVGPIAESVANNDTQETSPRPSSTFSHSSSQGIDRQDSPITSIDEDSKFRLQPTRKTSGKVHELVGMYDDLDKAVITESPPVEIPEAPRRTGSAGGSQDSDKAAEEEEEDDEDEQDAADFGDFEDAAEGDDGSGQGSGPNSENPDRPSTPRGRISDTVPHTPAAKSPELQSPLAKATSAAVGQLIEKYGPIRFDVDLKEIDKLFPAVDEPETENREHSEVPDRLITDSFASISERKAWYRISRFGPSRKHDSGDDENYHRITWSTSETRSETLKIVRRWMEEDSYTGRAVLGGGKRTSAFNWDSTAAPVDLNEIFGRKSSLHSRASSVQQQQQQQQHKTSSVHSVGPSSASGTAPRASTSSRNAAETPATPLAAGFGWSSTVSESPRIDAGTPNRRSRQSIEPPPSRPVSISAPPTSAPGTCAKAPSPIQPPQPLTSKAAEILEDDEDDDWGEMVSSPQVETHLSIDQVVSAPEKTQPPRQSQEDIPPITSPISPPAADPWAFADFSVFDAGPTGSPTVQLKPSPMPVPTEAEPSAGTKAGEVPTTPSSVRSPVQETEAPAPALDLAPKAVLGPIEETGSEQEHDEIVRKIVQNLPDLSYMLR